MIAEPPLADGAVKETVALAFPEDALTPVGAPGTVVVEVVEDVVEDFAVTPLPEHAASTVSDASELAKNAPRRRCSEYLGGVMVKVSGTYHDLAG